MGANNPQSPSLLFLLCLCFSMFSTHVPRASSLSFNLNFSDPSSVCGLQINCTGNASVNQEYGMLELPTKDGGGINNSIGRAIYAKPVPLWDATGGAKLLASFTTSFTFRSGHTLRASRMVAAWHTPTVRAVPSPEAARSRHRGVVAADEGKRCHGLASRAGPNGNAAAVVAELLRDAVGASACSITVSLLQRHVSGMVLLAHGGTPAGPPSPRFWWLCDRTAAANPPLSLSTELQASSLVPASTAGVGIAASLLQQ